MREKKDFFSLKLTYEANEQNNYFNVHLDWEFEFELKILVVVRFIYNENRYLASDEFQRKKHSNS